MPGSRRTYARGAPRAGAEDRNDDFYRYCFAFFCPDLSNQNHQAPLRYRRALGSTLAVVHGTGCFTDEPEELRATALEFRLWDLYFGLWRDWTSADWRFNDAQITIHSLGILAVKAAGLIYTPPRPRLDR